MERQIKPGAGDGPAIQVDAGADSLVVTYSFLGSRSDPIFIVLRADWQAYRNVLALLRQDGGGFSELVLDDFIATIDGKPASEFEGGPLLWHVIWGAVVRFFAEAYLD